MNMATTELTKIQVVHNLTYMSMGMSTLIFVLSMLDLGFASVFTNIALSALTTIYHVTILVLHRRGSRHPVSANAWPGSHLYPTSKIASLVCAYILACFWFWPVSLIAVTGSLHGDGGTPGKLHSGSQMTVLFQLVFDVFESGLVLGIAGISTRMRVIALRATGRVNIPIVMPGRDPQPIILHF